MEVVAIDNKKLLRYSIQLSMLKQLLIKHLIDDRVLLTVGFVRNQSEVFVR